MPYCEQPLGIELLVFHGLRVFMLTDAKGRFWIVAGSGTDKQINQCPNLCLILASIAPCLSQYAHQFQQNRLIFSSSGGDQVRITRDPSPLAGSGWHEDQRQCASARAEQTTSKIVGHRTGKNGFGRLFPPRAAQTTYLECLDGPRVGSASFRTSVPNGFA